MNKNIAISLFTVALVCVFFTNNIYADTYPKRELRSSWLATVWALDWPKTKNKATSASGVATQKSELDELLDNLKNAGFNAVSFQVRSMCDAMYKSSYEPWNQYLAGTRGKEPYNKFDPLAYCVEQAHARGMECHAWVNPFRFASNDGSSHTTTQDNYYRNNGMLMTHETLSGTATILNPALASVRTRIKDICHEIATNYDIDGIMFDDYFYNPSYIPEDETAQDYTNYENYRSTGGTMTMAEWRRDNINKTLKLIYDDLQTIKNGTIRFGLSPQGIGGGNGGDGVEPHPEIPSIDSYNIITNDSQYGKIYSDPVAWIKGGYIDYISPQIYWVTTQEKHPFGPLCDWWSDVAYQFGRHCYVSHTISALEDANTEANWKERATQIKLNREYSNDNAPGCVLYSTAYISGHKASGLGDYLKTNTFQYKSLPPEITWKRLDNPGLISNFTKNGTTLSWDDLDSDVRYTVYAIPLTINPKEAASTVHNGIKAEYLLDFTYNNSYTIPSDKTSGYWYAVAPFDRLCKEWEATTIDAPATEPVNISLIAPNNDITVDLISQEFTWEGDEGATFTIEISPNNDFTTITYTESTTAHSVSIDTQLLSDATTYYWRIVATRNGYITTTSEVRTFTTSTRPIVNVSLSSPNNNETISQPTQNFTWEGDAKATFTLVISTDESFSSPIFTQTTTDNYYALETSSLSPLTQYYWRVIGNIDGYIDGMSETRSFLTPDIPAYKTPYLYKLDNWATVNSDILFIVTDVYADATYLEISDTEDFSSIFYSGSTRWLPILGDDGKDYLEYTLPISYFTNGTYYWRIRTEKENYKDGISETLCFYVVEQEEQVNNYTMRREQHEYEYISIDGDNGLTLTNIWIRSDNHENGLGQTETGSNNRGFCARATDNTLYLSGRDADKNSYLDCYNATTGAYIKRLNLTGDIETNYRPCNNVFLDDYDNICINNMTLQSSTSTYTLQIASINPSTGAATERFATSVNERFDHCDVVGDITSGNFYVVAVSSTDDTKIHRWTVVKGVINTPETQTISSYYPTTVTDFGTAPRIYAIDASNFYVDCMSTSFTLYQWGNSKAIGDFSQASSLAPKSNQANGGTFFTHDGTDFIVYVSEDHTCTDGYKFNITSVPDHIGSYSGMKKRWTIPQEFIGYTKNGGGDHAALADVIQYKTNSAQKSSTPEITQYLHLCTGQWHSSIHPYTTTKNRNRRFISKTC